VITTAEPALFVTAIEPLAFTKTSSIGSNTANQNFRLISYLEADKEASATTTCGSGKAAISNN
jgi:hypothetical protein